MTTLPDTWIDTLWRAHTGLTLGLLAVLVLRRPWRRRAGPQAAYALWLLPPWLALAALWPSTGLPHLTLPAVHISTLTALPSAATPEGAQAGAQALWLAGLIAVAWAQTARHHRYRRQLQGRGLGPWRAPAGDSPGLLGVWRPRLVLPADFRQRFAADERRWILAHEATHARRLDNSARMLATLLTGLAWFNPLMWWGLAALRQDQELACDAAVMQRYPGSWRRYGLALLKLDGATGLPPTASAWQARHPLKERIMLLKNAAPSVRARQAAHAALALSAVLGFGAVQALNTGTPEAAKPTAHRSRSELSDVTAQRAKVSEACPDMPLPPGPPPEGLKGDYLVDVKFKIGRGGHADAVQVQGDPRLVDIIRKTVQAYVCKTELADAELEQQFLFKFD
ncbi:M56 family metallopeptidase [Roseateles sp.]|uniref:M56 family metallopeptidase n=1 Tax=Roseateles sp. TaxID=1971397 RepID=UPI003267D12C